MQKNETTEGESNNQQAQAPKKGDLVSSDANVNSSSSSTENPFTKHITKIKATPIVPTKTRDNEGDNVNSSSSSTNTSDKKKKFNAELEKLFGDLAGTHIGDASHVPRGFANADPDTFSDDESVYSLLSEDRRDGDFEVLGASFNHDNKNGTWIPGNNIHRQLNAAQNAYREEFYAVDKGQLKVEYKEHEQYGVTFDKVYAAAKKATISRQHRYHQQGEMLDPGTVKFKAFSSDGKKKEAVSISKWVDPAYPNFAAAKLSYISDKDGKLHSKFIYVDRDSLLNQRNGTGHSEESIFEAAKTKLEQLKAKGNIKRVILDISSALSMCNYQNSYMKLKAQQCCQDLAKKFVEDADTIGCGDVLVRVSWNFLFGNSNNQIYDRVSQNQIEIPEAYAYSKSFVPASVVPSCNGYKNYKDCIDSVDREFRETFLRRGLEAKFQWYNRPTSEKYKLPEGFQNVPGDGFCFFHAVIAALGGNAAAVIAALDESVPAAEIAVLDESVIANMIHNIAINHIIQNQGQFQTFVGGIEGMPPWIADMSPQQALETYIDHHMQHHDGGQNQWADHLMIQATANALNINIAVQMFDVNGNPNPSPLLITPQGGAANTTVALANIANVHFMAATTGGAIAEGIIGAARAQQRQEGALVDKRAHLDVNNADASKDVDKLANGLEKVRISTKSGAEKSVEADTNSENADTSTESDIEESVEVEPSMLAELTTINGSFAGVVTHTPHISSSFIDFSDSLF